MLAERYHWTPAQVNEMDPDVLEEITARISAEQEVIARRRAEEEAERARQERARRRAERERRGGIKGTEVDMSEIV